MKVFFDIYHLPQYNFFRNAIKQLGPEVVDLGCVNRGKLATVIRHECPEFNLYVYGDYKYNKGPFSMAARIIIPRTLKLISLFRKNKYDVVGTAHYQANVAAKLLGIPNFSILDDPRAGVLQMVKKATDEFYLPPFSENYEDIKKFNALKEWAYLSPKYLTPSIDVLSEYGLKAKDYIFIREVSTDTSNYLSQEKHLALQLAESIGKDTKVVLSLEDKSIRDRFPSNWIILNEPVSDIHSLLYYSNLVISSGDSMAREGGMMGVPSVYLGNRDMPANRILIEHGILKKMELNELKAFFESGADRLFETDDQDTVRKTFENEWDDVTQLILNLTKNLKK